MTTKPSNKSNTKNNSHNKSKQLKLDFFDDQDMAVLNQQLTYLKLKGIMDCVESTALKAAKEGWSYLSFLTQLVELETNLRQERATDRRVKAARFPVLKTLQQFKWNWPKKINPLQVKELFRLQFLKQQSNIIFLGGVGLGKTHIATALGYHACLNGHKVLFINTIDAINTLMLAKKSGRFKLELRKYTKPGLLILDELGYLPIDKSGADCLFQIISGRYETGSTIITTNRAFKDWPEIFNNDSTLTSALLDRLLHHAQTVIIEGESYRMKDQVKD